MGRLSGNGGMVLLVLGFPCLILGFVMLLAGLLLGEPECTTDLMCDLQDLDLPGGLIAYVGVALFGTGVVLVSHWLRTRAGSS